MTGAVHNKDAPAQQPAHGATAPAASANGNSTINKKRKKDGLKPIITTEGPGYVHCALLVPRCRDRSRPWFFVFFFLSFPFLSSVPSLIPRVGVAGSDVPKTTSLALANTRRGSAARASAGEVAGCDRRAMGPTSPPHGGEGKAQKHISYPCAHAATSRCTGAWVWEFASSNGEFSLQRYFVVVFRVSSSELGRICLALLPRICPPSLTYRFPTPPARSNRARRRCRPVTVCFALLPSSQHTLFRWTPTHCNCASRVRR